MRDADDQRCHWIVPQPDAGSSGDLALNVHEPRVYRARCSFGGKSRSTSVSSDANGYADARKLSLPCYLA